MRSVLQSSEVVPGLSLSSSTQEAGVDDAGSSGTS